MSFVQRPRRVSTLAESEPLSVSELTARMKLLLEGEFPSVWVAGEITNFSRPRSGHCYFTLQDERAQLRAVIWRSTAARLRFEPEDGLEVVCHGAIDLYVARGSYQLVIDQIHPKGMGELELRWRQLYEKLAREGLFDPSRKRSLPKYPRRIAMVTSPTGAAVRDFLEVARRRWPAMDVLVVPVRVQGEGAAREIAQGIQLVNSMRAPIDILVVGRGGGSMEDLWAFNEETVVRAIHASRIPVVSAVGHEIDVTLADLVADVRALTPSEAAERVAPDMEETILMLRELRRRIGAAVRGVVLKRRTGLESVRVRIPFRKPFDRVHDLFRRLDELSARGRRAASRIVERTRLIVSSAGGRLDSLSPIRVLERGYSVSFREGDDRPISDASLLQAGERLESVLARGKVFSRVERTDIEARWIPRTLPSREDPTHPAADA